MWGYLLIGLGSVIIYFIVMMIIQRKTSSELTQDQFIEGYRKAQIIDVREANEYTGGHILGARNIPMSQITTRINELRKDQPIYLYCQNNFRTGRVAVTLYRKGYRNIYTLKGGFKMWTGKIKKG